jgi:hypothetical protein
LRGNIIAHEIETVIDKLTAQAFNRDATLVWASGVQTLV